MKAELTPMKHKRDDNPKGMACDNIEVEMDMSSEIVTSNLMGIKV